MRFCPQLLQLVLCGTVTCLTAVVLSEPARLVVVGDVHNHWSERDVLALQFLQPDAALFVGDFGEEVVQLVEAIKGQVNTCSIPAAYILGNHDAW